MARFRKPRRGVLLLVVLSLLVLFVLIGVTFIITTGQFRRAASNSVRIERSGDAPAKLTQMAAFELLRGTRNARSALYGHSLLNDMYGQDGVRLPVASANVVAGSNGELLQIVAAQQPQPIQPVSDAIQPYKTFSSSDNLAIAGFYNGGVLTMTSGRGAGRSTRILRYDAAAVQFVVMAFPGEVGFVPAPNDTFIVNGPAFNGVGAGYVYLSNPPSMDQSVTVGSANYPSAFLPNLSAYASAGITDANRELTRRGGFDESYDVADYQNMFLGWVPADTTLQANLLIPSFHRPALVNYFQNGSGGPIPSTNKELWRTVILRPTQLDHPQFTGSNRNAIGPFGFDPINGPWDVDNDGNGIEDSVWVDLGLPPQQALDGRMYKPLFAILCVDLDGRLNLNAHGSRAQVEGPVPLDTTTPPFPYPQFLAGSNPSTQFSLIRGEGFGPADVDLAPAFLTSVNSVTLSDRNDLRAVIARRYDGLAAGEYEPGVVGTLAQPQGIHPTRAQFVRPPDFHGVGAVGIDHAGQPVFGNFNPSIYLPLDKNPYDLNLVSPNHTDAPFLPAHLEGLLRFYDFDRSSDEPRLFSESTALLPSFNDVTNPFAVANRGAVTSDSFEVPVPAVPHVPTSYFGSNANLTMYPTELILNQKMNLNRPFGDGEYEQMLQTPSSHPLEISGYAVVDDAAEIELLQNTNPPAYASWLNDVAIPGEPYPLRQAYARHLYCTMMSLIASSGATAIDLNYNGIADVMDVPPNSGVISPVTARAVAQWAINVVDFRDSDSIMTPFAYDENPLDGWGLAVPPTVVWGCERPELLLTESLATHDRRTEDLANEEQNPDDPSDFPNDTAAGDTDWDQRLRPMGSLFIELYNPWFSTYSVITNPSQDAELPPADLYGPAVTPPKWSGVMLNAVSQATDPTVGSSPVWRILIVKKGAGSNDSRLADPDFPQDQLTHPVGFPGGPSNFDNSDVDRVIYFASHGTGAGQASLSSITDYPPTTNRDVLAPTPDDAARTDVIAPGRYAVIGPGAEATSVFQFPGGLNMSTFGRALNANGSGLPYGDGQGLKSAPHMVVGVGQNFGADIDTLDDVFLVNGFQTAGVSVSVVSRALRSDGTLEARRLSISEPVGGYDDPSNSWDAVRAAREGEFNPPYDVPFDSRSGSEIADVEGKLADHRALFLQRLADPTRSWNAATNPYRTIDQLNVDLNVFNGVEKNEPNQLGVIEFASKERGREQSLNTAPVRNLWSVEPPRPPLSGAGQMPDATPTTVFPYQLTHSFGQINTVYGAILTDNSYGRYVGQPDTSVSPPFPWLTWNNRPFANVGELQLVPRSSSSRLLHHFSLDLGGVTGNYYNSTLPPAPANWPFFHLLKFTDERPGGGSPTGPGLARLFDFVDVPSRFAGTQKFFDPNVFNASAGPFAATLRYPFNTMSRFRDPGLVNLNTTTDFRVFNGMLGSLSFDTNIESIAYWNLLQQSLRVPGFDLTTNSATNNHLNPDYPTQFLTPFKSATHAGFEPTVSAMPSLAMTPAQTGLLRRLDPTNPANQAPAFAWSLTNSYADATRNPYFRFKLVNRLESMSTTRSSVFAVWITVGYFELIQTPPDAVHPDGYQLGRERGLDTGQVERHRAFYIMDRSIPVGFEPGENHNVEDAIRLQRYIE